MVYILFCIIDITVNVIISFFPINASSLLNANFKMYAIYKNANEIVIASGDKEENPSIAIGMNDNANIIFFPNGIFFIAK